MPSGGWVIHIGSSMARYAFGGASVYTLTKGAVAGFNRSLARSRPTRHHREHGPSGPTDTDMNPDGGPISKIVGPGMAVGRYGRRGDRERGRLPRQPRAAFITGAELWPTAASPPEPDGDGT